MIFLTVQVMVHCGLGAPRPLANFDNDDPLSDCEKKIYDDCNGETQERDSNGACRDRNNCTAACDGGKGTV